MEGLLVAGGDTPRRVGIAQHDAHLWATSTCCDNAMSFDAVDRLYCTGCQRLVLVKGAVPVSTSLRIDSKHWTLHGIFAFVEGWTGLKNREDMLLTVEW
jgi:hypothetical protein